MAVYLIESKADQQKLIDHVGEDLAKLFFTLKDRLKSPENDIYYWLKREPGELENRLDELQNTKTRKEKDEEASEGAELVYNQDGWKVYHIATYEASAKYGKNTQWCITGSKRWSNGERGEEYFNQYVKSGVEFYFYIKDGNEKYALAMTPQNGNYQVFNAKDDDITDKDLSFLPNVKGLPEFNVNYLLSEDGTFTYIGKEVPKTLCSNVKQVKFSNGVTEICENAFKDCTNLQSIEIPEGITTIGRCAFWGCSSLKSVVLPELFTTIHYCAFYKCKSLEFINLPDSITYMDNGAFFECESLKAIDIPTDLTFIGVRAFFRCAFELVVIPNSVTFIGEGAFEGCESLKSILIPNSVNGIDSFAFNNCYPLTVYTDNEIAIEYCERKRIPYKPANEFPG